MREIIVWAQSVCRSTMALFREVKRQAGVPVTVVMRRDARGEDARRMRESQGQGACEFADVVDLEWDGEEQSGRGIFAAHCGEGAVHVFSGYQVSAAVRTLMQEAKEKGLRIVEYDEAPCEMCVGPKAFLKRMYYRFVLPGKLQRGISAADVFLNASGMMGIDRLVRLGWPREKIVPFGYASEGSGKFEVRSLKFDVGSSRPLRVLHTGVEMKYRGVGALKGAAELLRRRGVDVEVKFTGGKVDAADLPRLYEWADVFVACGLCEPWGMRVNDAIHAGLPVVVSDGMGASWLVEQFGCGCIFAKGDAESLADSLARFSQDADWSMSLASGVSAAHAAWTPEARAKVFLDILGK